MVIQKCVSKNQIQNAVRVFLHGIIVRTRAHVGKQDTGHAVHGNMPRHVVY